MTTDDPTPARVSLRDIATKLGISHSSVSLALRNHPRISAVLTRKIQETARELGYRPDPMLAALAHYRQGKVKTQVRSVIAWINAWHHPEELRSFHEFDFYWQGASAAAHKMGYRLEEFRMDSECPPARLEQILRTRGVRGILIPPHHDTPNWGDFDWSQFCAVRFGDSCKSPKVHIVTSDQLENTILAYNAVTERGYKRIGFITAGQGTARGVRSHAGYFVAQRQDKLGLRLRSLILNESDPNSHLASVKEWLKTQKPDAILTDISTIPDLLAKAGCRVPEDVGLAVESVLDRKADAGIDQHPVEVGRVAFLAVLSLLHDYANGVPSIFRQILVSGSWVDGKSLPRR